ASEPASNWRIQDGALVSQRDLSAGREHHRGGWRIALDREAIRISVKAHAGLDAGSQPSSHKTLGCPSLPRRRIQTAGDAKCGKSFSEAPLFGESNRADDAQVVIGGLAGEKWLQHVDSATGTAALREDRRQFFGVGVTGPEPIA